jgi:hypothetical protein
MPAARAVSLNPAAQRTTPACSVAASSMGGTPSAAGGVGLAGTAMGAEAQPVNARATRAIGAGQRRHNKFFVVSCMVRFSRRGMTFGTTFTNITEKSTDVATHETRPLHGLGPWRQPFRSRGHAAAGAGAVQSGQRRRSGGRPGTGRAGRKPIRLSESELRFRPWFGASMQARGSLVEGSAQASRLAIDDPAFPHQPY